jgi:hypothetical protein
VTLRSSLMRIRKKSVVLPSEIDKVIDCLLLIRLAQGGEYEKRQPRLRAVALLSRVTLLRALRLFRLPIKPLPFA